MGSATWHCETFVEGNADAVYAWLTDFSADDHNSPAYKRGAGIDPNKKMKPAKRRVVSREGNVLRVEDEWGGSKFTATVTLDPVARAVRIQGGMGYDSTWRATAEGNGTRLIVDGRMGKGLLGSMVRLFEKRVQRSMQQDFDGHVEDLREHLLAARKGT